MSLREEDVDRVYNAIRAGCNTAVDENKYTELLTMDPEQLAIDVMDNDYEVELLKLELGLEVDDVKPLVERWQRERANR